jgi:hypothetical protein
MTAHALRAVALGCEAALEATSYDDAQEALSRARVPLQQIRATATPLSRHRRVAESVYELTHRAFEPMRRSVTFGDDEQERIEADFQDASRRVKAENAIRRVLDEFG